MIVLYWVIIQLSFCGIDDMFLFSCLAVSSMDIDIECILVVPPEPQLALCVLVRDLDDSMLDSHLDLTCVVVVPEVGIATSFLGNH